MTGDPWGLGELDVPEDELVFNGVDSDTGAYLFPNAQLDGVASAVRGEQEDREHAADLKARSLADTEDVLAIVYGRRPDRLDQAGWALVAADDVGPEILEALTPLRDRRRQQAGALYRELCGLVAGVHAGESSQDFLVRHDVDPHDVADPRQLPYYVLLVGSPDRLSFSMQYQLGVQRAVGRLHFDTPDQYARYAENVLAAETGPDPGDTARRMHVFAARNPGDLPTALSASRLAYPLTQDPDVPAAVTSDIGENATKQRLTGLLQNDERLALLFTATHGVGTAGPKQREIQGALLCQDWQGPLQGPLTGAEYLSGDDLDSARPISAAAIVSFGCYTAGTPHTTDFIDAPVAPAGQPFIARLAQRLLAHPRGGCLALVGHVDRAWNCSFLWKGVKPRILPFTSTIGAFLDGAPIGMAMEYMTAKYAATASELSSLLHEVRAYGRIADDRELAQLWLATNDARNFLIIGDPAVRLRAHEPAALTNGG
jgi:Peptidase family C25